MVRPYEAAVRAQVAHIRGQVASESTIADWFGGLLAAIDDLYVYPRRGAGANHIDADPLFVDADSGDYRLLPNSPAIDAGDNAAVLPGDTDIDGCPRRVGAPCRVESVEFPLVFGWVASFLFRSN